MATLRRTWAGWKAESKTRADNYVLEISASELIEPLRGFVITSAVAVDILFHQGEPSREDARRQRSERIWG